MNPPKLEVGATYKVSLEGDGVWEGAFTSKLILQEEEKFGPDNRYSVLWLTFANGVRMTMNWACSYEKAEDAVPRPLPIEKTNAGTPIDFRTRPEEVPEFLSCGHNAHWTIWHSIAKGEPCILCRAERAEAALKDLLDRVEGGPLEEMGEVAFRHPLISLGDISRWKGAAKP